MFMNLFEELGLSPNEGKLYEVLLRNGELGIGPLAIKASVNRRNVYDAIKRLLGRGLVQEVIHHRESSYRPVSPDHLMQLLDDKRSRLSAQLPQLMELYQTEEEEEFVTIYHGVEGWKSYMRDILLVGEDYYCLGAKGGWWDERIRPFFLKSFLPEAKRKKIVMYHLFDYEVKVTANPIVKNVGPHFRFLPVNFSTPASVEIFGPYVNLISKMQVGEIHPRESFAVIKNRRVADSFRSWFKLLWDNMESETNANQTRSKRKSD